jgi:hypothetical protein
MIILASSIFAILMGEMQLGDVSFRQRVPKTMSLGTRFTNAISCFELGPQEYRDISLNVLIRSGPVSRI